ncbi:hypothetical protein DY000_02025221 [Brassica cretica]|uniref:Uncharacterized protein n=1 Tax=Brassica cretica TaxID=69181 RepID=A0ABQ7ECD7_BRACR|nr:hypothetical protein DY000_02025221 [Brassica cretica]
MPSSYVSVVESEISNATNEAAPRHALVRPQTLRTACLQRDDLNGSLLSQLRWWAVSTETRTIRVLIQTSLQTWENLTGTGGAEELSMMIETNSSSKLYDSSGHGELVVRQRSSVKPLAS